jgi:hypothetical protein
MNSAYAVREAMDTPADIFNGYRPRLFGIAYRMLGSRPGEPGLIQKVDGKLESVMSFVIAGLGDFAVYIVRNPKDLSI